MYSVLMAVVFAGAEPSFHERHVVRGGGCQSAQAGCRGRQVTRIRHRSHGCQGGNYTPARVSCTPSTCPGGVCPEPAVRPANLSAAPMLCPCTLNGGVCKCDPCNCTTATQTALLESHNRIRAVQGLPALALDCTLCNFAQVQSEAQAARGQLFHSNLGSIIGQAQCTAMAENVASGGPDVAVSNWQRSSGHANNIRGPYTRVGFGLRNGFVTALFGR